MIHFNDVSYIPLVLITRVDITKQYSFLMMGNDGVEHHIIRDIFNIFK